MDCWLATAGLTIKWGLFWSAIADSRQNIMDILGPLSFFKTLTVTVMGVIAGTVVFSLAGRLEGSITGAILSGGAVGVSD